MTYLPDEEFRAWLLRRLGPNPPAVATIDLGECPFPVPAAYATTREGFQALQAHNARVGVFA